MRSCSTWGETLVDEKREYGTWADWLGVPRHTFSSVFGAVIALGADYREAFQYFRPGFDLAAALRDMGVWVGVAGNQTSRAGGILRKLDLPADMIATSDDWGAVKPDAAFFRELLSATPWEAREIVYVGDRLDNDLKPAKAAGMRTAFIRRGPWGYILEGHPDMADAADWRMTSLAELPGLVGGS